MMSAVFLMQPLGQLMAWIVGISTVTGLSRYYDLDGGRSCNTSEHASIGIDIFWRIVVGVGAVVCHALVAQTD
jgi:PHS family inorganic phosphate transporter-like MFS transporter